MTKIQALRDVILLLVDSQHRARIDDLLTALEQEVGAAAIRHAASIIQSQADDAPLAYSNRTFAQIALQNAARTVRHSEYERNKN
jgi:hypothetical protein